MEFERLCDCIAQTLELRSLQVLFMLEGYEQSELHCVCFMVYTVRKAIRNLIFI